MEGSAMVLQIFFLVLVMASWFLFTNKKRRPQRNEPKLPPGSMGWPVVGETLKLYSQSPSVFFGSRHRRYGDIFKTNIHGNPCVMLTCPEAARFVLVTGAHLFRPTYPRSKERLIGPWAVFYRDGGFHTKMKKLVQGSLSLDRVRTMVPDIEAIAVSTLESCCCKNGGRPINTYHEMKKFSFEVAILSIFGELDSNLKDKLRKDYLTLDKGYNSFPINLPGTSYRRALLARGRLSQILSDVMSERKEKRLEQMNLLSSLLNYRDKKGEILTDDQIVDNIVGVFFAAQDTTASALTWIIKYIHDDCLLMENIKMEQKEIYESNDRGNRPLTWAQTRDMPYTHKFVMESLRMASIITHIYREAVEDIDYHGVLIPKGWKVMPLFWIIHHNPDLFADPENFNPSRFEVAQKPNTFVPFGNGVHSCPGNEIAKLEILIFIHHLVNKFRWEVVGPKNGVEYDPFAVPRKGLLAKFSRVSSE